MTFSRSVPGSITSRLGPNDTAYSHAISSTSKPTCTFFQPRSSVSSVSITRAKRPAKLNRNTTDGETQNDARYFGALDLNVDADCSQYSARLKSTGMGAASSNTSTCEMRDTRYVRTCPSTAPTRYHTLPFATNPNGLIKRSTGSQFSPRSYMILSLRSIQSASCNTGRNGTASSRLDQPLTSTYIRCRARSAPWRNVDGNDASNFSSAPSAAFSRCRSASSFAGFVRNSD